MDDATLRSIPLFAGLEAEALAAIRRASTIRAWPAGALLWREGQVPGGLVIVLEGRVRILRSRHGRQYVVHHEGPGGTLGEVPLFDGGRYPATAVAASRVRGLIVADSGLREAMANDASLARALLGRLASRVRGLVERLHDATFGTVRSRLAAHILARATTARAASFTLAGTQAQVAEELGTVREVVAREIASMRAAGILEAVGGGRMAVVDEGRLEALSAGRTAALRERPDESGGGVRRREGKA
jgi:CRP/FNR family transcriptional regulator